MSGHGKHFHNMHDVFFVCYKWKIMAENPYLFKSIMYPHYDETRVIFDHIS